MLARNSGNKKIELNKREGSERKSEGLLTCKITGDSDVIIGRVFSGVALGALPAALHLAPGSTFSLVLSVVFSLFSRAAIAPT